MRNLTHPALIKFKGFLFLFAGVASAALVVLENPTLKTALLLALAIWCCCRAYYFAFYVIEHYVDPGYHFSGLWSFARYLTNNRSQRNRRSRPDGGG